MNEETKDLKYWKNNCEEDYIKTPISVLRYISELEKAITVTHCCKSDSEQLKHGDIKLNSYVEMTLTEKHNGKVVWIDGDEIGVENKNRAYKVSRQEITKVF